jgi:hypothetical protein
LKTAPAWSRYDEEAGIGSGCGMGLKEDDVDESRAVGEMGTMSGNMGQTRERSEEKDGGAGSASGSGRMHISRVLKSSETRASSWRNGKGRLSHSRNPRQ